MIFKRLKQLETTVEMLQARIEHFEWMEQRRREGKHDTGAWCKGCKHHRYSGNGEMASIYGSCKLDYSCVDREEISSQ